MLTLESRRQQLPPIECLMLRGRSQLSADIRQLSVVSGQLSVVSSQLLVGLVSFFALNQRNKGPNREPVATNHGQLTTNHGQPTTDN